MQADEYIIQLVSRLIDWPNVCASQKKNSVKDPKNYLGEAVMPE